MKNLLLTIAIFLISTTTFCQEEFWELLDTPEGVEFEDIAKVYGNTLLATSWDSGIYISFNNGDTWQKNSNIHSTESICVISDSKVLITQGRSRVIYSLDTCKTYIWTPHVGGSCFEIPLFVDSDNRIYAGAAGSVYRSTDWCETWDTVLFHGDSFSTGISSIELGVLSI